VFSLPHSSAVIHARLSAMPHHWYNSVLACIFFSKDQTGKNLMLQGQHCRVEVVGTVVVTVLEMRKVPFL